MASKLVWLDDARPWLKLPIINCCQLCILHQDVSRWKIILQGSSVWCFVFEDVICRYFLLMSVLKNWGVECHDVPLSFCCWPNLGQWWANDPTVKCAGISAKEVVAFRIPALGSSTRQERQVVRMGRVLFVDLRNHTCTRPVDKTKDGWIPKLNMRVKHCGEIIQLKIRTVLMLMITWLTCLDIPPLILYDHVAAQCLVQYLCEDLVYWVYFKDL